MSKLKIAIVGCGGIANQKHMPSLKTQADKAEMRVSIHVTHYLNVNIPLYLFIHLSCHMTVSMI